MVRRIWIATWSWAVIGAFSLTGACGGDINPKTLNEPCTRTDQCIEGLVCLSGVCLAPDDDDDEAAADDSSIEPR